MRLMVTLKPALGIQLTKRDAEAYPVTAADIAVDNHGSDPGMMRTAAFQLRAEFLVDLDIGGCQFIESTGQAGFRVRVCLRCQVTWVEQNEFGGMGLDGTHLNNKVPQITTSAQLQRATRRMSLLLKLK
ncbi:hypothetical protein DYGSA30_32420 [Dyella sp. GSA-30]|nr:hypothetical protein DYGSA30_32420 [Dyella sp. GSA-30]